MIINARRPVFVIGMGPDPDGFGDMPKNPLDPDSWQHHTMRFRAKMIFIVIARHWSLFEEMDKPKLSSFSIRHCPNIIEIPSSSINDIVLI